VSDQPGYRPEEPQGAAWPPPVQPYGAPPGLAPGQSYGTPYGYGPPPGTDSADTTIFILGLIGLIVCPLLGPIAWVRGKRRLDETRQRGWPDPGMAKAGWILGIIATAYMIFMAAMIAIGIVAGVVSNTSRY
jgi:hypothetical protein